MIRDRIANGVLWTIRKVFGAVERLTGEEPQPLLDNAPRGLCSSGCTVAHVVPGCPVHSPKVKP